MRKAIERFKNSHAQTKLFIFMSLLYLIALLWTTAQAYVRLAYNRTDLVSPIIINIPPSDHK